MKAPGVTSSGPCNRRPWRRARARSASCGIATSEAEDEHAKAAGEWRPREIAQPSPLVNPRQQKGVERPGVIAVGGDSRTADPRRPGGRRQA